MARGRRRTRRSKRRVTNKRTARRFILRGVFSALRRLSIQAFLAISFISMTYPSFFETGKVWLGAAAQTVMTHLPKEWLEPITQSSWLSEFSKRLEKGHEQARHAAPNVALLSLNSQRQVQRLVRKKGVRIDQVRNPFV